MDGITYAVIAVALGAASVGEPDLRFPMWMFIVAAALDLILGKIRRAKRDKAT